MLKPHSVGEAHLACGGVEEAVDLLRICVPMLLVSGSEELQRLSGSAGSLHIGAGLHCRQVLPQTDKLALESRYTCGIGLQTVGGLTEGTAELDGTRNLVPL